MTKKHNQNGDVSWDSVRFRIAHAVLSSDKSMDDEQNTLVLMTDFRVKYTGKSSEEFMFVAHGDDGQQKLVLFYSAQTPTEALVGGLLKVASGSAEVWKVDKPYVR